VQQKFCDKPRQFRKTTDLIEYFVGKLERVKGIEPSSGAWEALALPLSYTRNGHLDTACAFPSQEQTARCTGPRPLP